MSEPTALIVDDEADIRELVEITLGRMGVETTAVGDLAAAHAALSEQNYELCLTDMRLPDGDGIDLVRTVVGGHPDTPIAVITAHGSMDTAIAALKAGAFDFVSKPLDLDDLRRLAGQALRLGAQQQQPGEDDSLIGSSPAIEAVRRRAARVARSQAPVVVTGESGVGKELVARMIHNHGPRADRPFVPVNCGAIPRELMESEFFGHARGSFTGASHDKDGLFTAAAGGTLFLDEIAELPLDMQVKLLRAIQEKQIRPVGRTREIAVDVRIVSATQADLAQAVAAGHFREDLYYRINVIALHVPPLRERRDDIAPLAEAILQRIASDRTVTLSDDAYAALWQYHFPGNVRELENILEGALALTEGPQITADDLQLRPTAPVGGACAPTTAESGGAAWPHDDTVRSDSSPRSPNDPAADAHGADIETNSLDDQLQAQQRDMLLAALEQQRWNRTAVARDLGLTYRQLRYRLKKLGID